jgi:3-oxoacyl-[acyl-carrier protein] reductase
MKINLQNKNALVGGSTQGLGKAIAVQLAECGANVTLMARNEEKLKKAVKDLDTSMGQKHGYLVVDFKNLEEVKTSVKNFLAGNPVDILVNNTNGPDPGNALEKRPEDYQAAFDLLFQTVCFTTLEALPFMQKNNFGRIINVSSTSVKEPIRTLVLSNSIRSAVVSWAKTLSFEVARYNITVNNILTGNFDTERMRNIIKHQAAEKNMSADEVNALRVASIPAKRFGRPEEYGYLAAFLASDFASYITGASIPIDGGLMKSAG